MLISFELFLVRANVFRQSQNNNTIRQT